MAEQATGINMYMEHKYTDETTLGPVVEAQIRDNTLWVKGRVRKSKTDKVNDILEAGTHMGGSFGGICKKDYINESGSRMLDKVNLLDATFTPMPVNQATLGTASLEYKDCTVCNQIIKSIERKYDINISNKDVEDVETSKEDITMDKEEMKELLDANKASILDEVKELIKTPEPEPTPAVEVEKEVEVPEVKEVDENKIAENVTANVLKALGIEPEEEAEEPEAKLVVMDAKTLEQRDEELIQKALKSIAKAREGEPKSKRLGGPKFINPEEKSEPEDETKEVKKVSTRKAAEMIVANKGLA